MPPEKSDKLDSSDKSGTGAADKGSSLSDKLKEFSDATQERASAKDLEKRLSETESRLKAYDDAEAERQIRTEMDSFMVPTVRGDLDVHPKLVEQWILDESNRNPALVTAWSERGKDRGAYEKAVDGLKDKFKAYAEKESLIGTSKGKSSAQAKLQSAVRSARETTSAPQDFSNVNLAAMSDNDFAMHKATVFALSAAGKL